MRRGILSRVIYLTAFAYRYENRNGYMSALCATPLLRGEMPRDMAIPRSLSDFGIQDCLPSEICQVRYTLRQPVVRRGIETMG